MWLFIEPLDVWMFRDGKPFTAGGNHTANSLFPPSAFTVQGMLRSLLLSKEGADWETLSPFQGRIGGALTLGDFKMRGPYLARWINNRYERLFPLPADVVRYKPRGEYKDNLAVLRPDVGGFDGYSDLKSDLHPLKPYDDYDEPGKNYWMSERVFVERYLNQREFDATNCIEEEELIHREYRYGNALDYSRRGVRSDEGMLYAATFIRLADHVGLLVELPDPSPLATLFSKFGDCEFTRFGGEGRAARVTRIDPATLDRPMPPTIAAGSPVKLVFITPAYFKNRSSDPGVASNPCLAAAVRRPIAIGGWDLQNKSPRAILRFVAPGSVYHFANNQFSGSQRCDEPDQDYLSLTSLGFGEFMIGASQHIEGQ